MQSHPKLTYLEQELMLQVRPHLPLYAGLAYLHHHLSPMDLAHTSASEPLRSPFPFCDPRGPQTGLQNQEEFPWRPERTSEGLPTSGGGALAQANGLLPPSVVVPEVEREKQRPVQQQQLYQRFADPGMGASL